MTIGLVVVDVQNDFISGNLSVPGGEEIVSGINELVESGIFDEVAYTQDWHGPDHSSFAVNHGKPVFSTTEMSYGTQVLWPTHCVQGTWGAEFRDNLVLKGHIIRKGSNRDIDSYSAFFENDRVTSTGFDDKLKNLGVTTLAFTGLAFDYCVGYSALDALKLGYEVYVIVDLARGIAPESMDAMRDELVNAGAVLIMADEFKAKFGNNVPVV